MPLFIGIIIVYEETVHGFRHGSNLPQKLKLFYFKLRL